MSDPSGPVEFVHRSWPADADQLGVIRHELLAWLAPLGLTGDQTDDVVLAVDEAAANVVRHAYGPDEPGTVELTLWTEADALSIEVTDHGTWRENHAAGRGIGLMNHMVETVLIHFDHRGSRVLLRQRYPDGRAAADPVAGVVPEPGDEAADRAHPTNGEDRS